MPPTQNQPAPSPESPGQTRPHPRKRPSSTLFLEGTLVVLVLAVIGLAVYQSQQSAKVPAAAIPRPHVIPMAQQADAAATTLDPDTTNLSDQLDASASQLQSLEDATTNMESSANENSF